MVRRAVVERVGRRRLAQVGRTCGKGGGVRRERRGSGADETGASARLSEG